jgi:hypothetical protein
MSVFYVLAVHGLVTRGKSQVNISTEAAATGLFGGRQETRRLLGWSGIQPVARSPQLHCA